MLSLYYVEQILNVDQILMIDANSKKLSGYLPYAYNIFACTYVYYILIYDHIAYKIVFRGIPDISIKSHSSQSV